MKLTWKTKTSPAAACPCYDPIVFGHDEPCPCWETRHNDHPPPMTRQLIGAQFAASETMQDIQRLHLTVRQMHEVIREIGERTAPRHHG